MSSQANKSILVVEDDESIREVIKLILESAGYHVETAVNGADGVKVLKRGEMDGKRPDLIFLDLMMPVMDGWEFLDCFRRESLNENVPVVVLTASGLGTKPHGATAFFQKPVEMDDLLRVAEEYCARTA